MKIIIIDDSSSLLREFRFNLEFFLRHQVLTVCFCPHSPPKEYEEVLRQEGSWHDLYTVSIDAVVSFVEDQSPDLVLVDHQIHGNEERISGYHIVQRIQWMSDRIIGISAGGGQSYCNREFPWKNKLVSASSYGHLKTLTETQKSALGQLASIIDTI